MSGKAYKTGKSAIISVPEVFKEEIQVIARGLDKYPELLPLILNLIKVTEQIEEAGYLKGKALLEKAKQTHKNRSEAAKLRLQAYKLKQEQKAQENQEQA